MKDIGIIRFSAQPVKIGRCTIIRLPANVSNRLPSRGQVMAEVNGALRSAKCMVLLEPDGRLGHWFELNPQIQNAIGMPANGLIKIELTKCDIWPEPDVPAKLTEVMAANQKALSTWLATTTAARWEWVSWIESSGKVETRNNRIKAACDKLAKGERRPCCWNRNACADPRVCKNGVLIKAVSDSNVE